MNAKFSWKNSAVAVESNERRWAMVHVTRIASLGARVSLALAVCLLAAAPSVRALTRTDQPGAILVWPDIVVDSSSPAHKDTLIQLSNTDPTNVKQAHCFLVDANQHCSNSPTTVCRNALNDCSGGGFCVPGWSEIDFEVTLTPGQPVAWSAANGLQDFPLDVPPHCAFSNFSCGSDSDCGIGDHCLGLQNNLGSSVPGAPEDPFVGSLKCIELNTANPPQFDNDNKLIGHATIETLDSDGDRVDVAKYNAVGIRYTGLCVNNDVQTGQLCQQDSDCAVGSCFKPHPTGPSLQIGGDSNAEYAPCPSKLILNHLFDGAKDPIGGGTTSTTLTLVPCGDDFEQQSPGDVTAQFLVFNEFEQRFSAARLVDCFFQSPISNIDTVNSSRSIFNIKFAGTLAGSTWIRGVGSAPTGRGLLGVAILTAGSSSAGYDLHEQADPPAGTAPDVITVPGF
jgi:hypothetical protein